MTTPQPPPMAPTVIDVHVHTFPDDLAARVLEKLTGAALLPIRARAAGTVADLLDQMDTHGVAVAVLCPIATKPSHFEPILAEAVAVLSGARGARAARRLIPFGSVHPAAETRADQLRRLAEAGVRGIKLHPYYQRFVLDAPDTLEFFRCCRDLGLAVQCHCGFDVGFANEPLCGPERVARVVREVPGLRFIAAHLGGWRQWGGAAEHLLGEDVWLDTAFLPLDEHDAGARRLLREHRADRLLFATDWPWLGFDEGLRRVREAGRTPAETAAILGGNAAALLGLKNVHPCGRP